MPPPFTSYDISVLFWSLFLQLLRNSDVPVVSLLSSGLSASNHSSFVSCEAALIHCSKWSLWGLNINKAALQIVTCLLYWSLGVAG